MKTDQTGFRLLDDRPAIGKLKLACSLGLLAAGVAVGACGSDAESTGQRGGAGGGAGVAGSTGGSGAAVGAGGTAGTGPSGGTAGVGGTTAAGGTAGSGATGGGVGAGGSGGSGGTGECVKGQVEASQVIMIGDSYLDRPGNNIQYWVQQRARAAGALGANETYRRYYLGGTSMGNGQIPAQYDQAKAADPDIKVVIMDGGGNDVLILNRGCMTDPAPQNQSCVTTVQTAVNASRELMNRAAADGVTDVVFFFYPHLPPNGLLTGPAVNEMLDYAYPIVQAECENATALRCHFVDTRPAFEGKTGLIDFDGVHPTPAGSEIIGNLIWDKMVAGCVAQ